MFSRIREAVRILTYREPNSGPDAIIVDRPTIVASPWGRRIARSVEVCVGVFAIGEIATRVINRLIDLAPTKHFTSTTVLVGALSAFLVIVLHWIRNDLEQKFRAHLNLADRLAPYFGKRLTNASRVLRASTHVS